MAGAGPRVDCTLVIQPSEGRIREGVGGGSSGGQGEAGRLIYHREEGKRVPWASVRDVEGVIFRV